jgi:hypothetical protein
LFINFAVYSSFLFQFYFGMEKELTPAIKAWLDTDPDKRDLMLGATMLLQITRNNILFNNVTRNLTKKADVIQYHLQRAYNIRLQDYTKAQVKEMLVTVDAIDKSHALSKSQDSTRSQFQNGRRADHDTLPAEIQQLYVDNASILRQMRECHTKLRLINSDNSTCPDSDRYAFAKEIISLDKKYRQNWYTYDHYIPGSATSVSETASEPSDARAASARAKKLINLNKAKYAASRDAELAKKMKEWFAQVLNPSQKMLDELMALAII